MRPLLLLWLAVDQPWMEPDAVTTATAMNVGIVLALIVAFIVAAAKWGVRALFLLVAVIAVWAILR